MKHLHTTTTLLKLNNRTVHNHHANSDQLGRSATNLNDAGISEDIIQQVHVFPHVERIYNVVGCARRHLHETR